MLLMGESINGTRKQVAEAIQARDAEFIKTLATDQIGAGAGLLDVNGGVAGGIQNTVRAVRPATRRVARPAGGRGPDRERLQRASGLRRRPRSAATVC